MDCRVVGLSVRILPFQGSIPMKLFWTAGDTVGRAVSLAGGAASVVGKDVVLAAPFPMTEIGRRTVRPFSESLSKAGRVGKTDAFGDLIDPHMGVFEKFGRQRLAHAVDDGLIGKSVIAPVFDGTFAGKDRVRMRSLTAAGNRFGLLRQAARILRTSSDSPGRSVMTTSQTCWQIFAVIGFAFGQGTIEHLGIEVPLHAVGVEVDRAVEQPFVIAPVRRGRKRERSSAWSGRALRGRG